MTTEYCQKNNIPNLYEILGLTMDVCKQQNCDEIIRKAYIEKVKSCHPDKNPDVKNAEETLELLLEVYSILGNEKQRGEYNGRLGIYKQTGDFFKLKNETKDYFKSLGEVKEPTMEINLSFSKQMGELNTKHNFNSAQQTAIPKKEAKKKFDELQKQRLEQDKTLLPERLFDEGTRFNDKKFNAIFDLVHKRNDDGLVLRDGVPLAWNDVGNNNFCSPDAMDNLFDPAERFLDTVFEDSQHKATKDMLNDVKDADYVNNHNFLGDKYYQDIASKLRDRNVDNEKFNSGRFHDFRKDTAGYGILDKLPFDFEDDMKINKKVEKRMLGKGDNVAKTR